MSGCQQRRLTQHLLPVRVLQPGVVIRQGDAVVRRGMWPAFGCRGCRCRCHEKSACDRGAGRACPAVRVVMERQVFIGGRDRDGKRYGAAEPAFRPRELRGVFLRLRDHHRASGECRLNGRGRPLERIFGGGASQSQRTDAKIELLRSGHFIDEFRDRHRIVDQNRGLAVNTRDATLSWPGLSSKR